MPGTYFTDSKGTRWHVAEGLSVVWTPELGFDDHPETALMFDCAHEARRLFTYPSDWKTLPEPDLHKLLDQATQTWERESERADWVPVQELPLPEVDLAGTMVTDDVAEVVNGEDADEPSGTLSPQSQA